MCPNKLFEANAQKQCAAQAGVKGCAEVSDALMVLDGNAESSGKEGMLRYFFDC